MKDMNKEVFKNVQEGDRLWTPLFGWGKVESVDRYSFRMDYDRVLDYDFDGRLVGYENIPVSIFWNEMKIIPQNNKENETSNSSH